MKNIDKQVSEPVKNLVAYFGSQTKTATALGVKQPTVRGWLFKKHGITSLNAQKAERLTKGKVKAKDLCPSLAQLEDIK